MLDMMLSLVLHVCEVQEVTHCPQVRLQSMSSTFEGVYGYVDGDTTKPVIIVNKKLVGTGKAIPALVHELGHHVCYENTGDVENGHRHEFKRCERMVKDSLKSSDWSRWSR